MLSMHSGAATGYLTDPVEGTREGYYTGATADGEPPGLWYGTGAEALGLRGEVDATLMEAVYSGLLDPRDPAAHGRRSWEHAQPLCGAHRAYRSPEEMYAAALAAEPGAGPERREELRVHAQRNARQAVSFIDVTFSAPKSVTVLGVAFERAANDARRAGDDRAADAWAAHQRAVEDAVMAGARASIDYLAQHAGYSRVGHHGGGGGRWADAHHLVVAQFLQHDSRDHDPQLHVHQAILNRALCADGKWRALDGKAIFGLRGAASAVAERVMEAHLSRSLGVRFETRPDGKAREVIGVSEQVMGLFSSRRRTITGKTEQLVRAFRDKWSREPNTAELDRMQRQATLATRKAKSHDGESISDRLERWDRELRAEIKGGLSELAHSVLGLHQRAVPDEPWSPRDVIARAVAAAGQRWQTFSRSDLMRMVSDALPGQPGTTPETVVPLLDTLTDAALASTVRVDPTAVDDEPASMRLADGSSVFHRPGAARYATADQVGREWALRAAAVKRGAHAFALADANRAISRFAANGRELGADQAAAVRGVLTSGAMVETLAAPAGTGKSFTVGALAGAWRESGRSVFGLATSQIATQVLAEEGLDTRNITRWLLTQARLDTDRPGAPDPDRDRGWRLRRGDLVVLDEAGMTDTAALAEVQRRCEAASAKLLLVGDPRQLAAVGAGGSLSDLSVHGIRYELAEVRRFTEPWEGAASLRLREGDAKALDTYHHHGRLRDGGTVEQAEAAAGRAWLADTIGGRDALLLVGTNEAAARVSASIRAQLVALGRVQEAGVQLGLQGTVAGVGDLVQARRNAWELADEPGNVAAPINRQCYRVREVGPDGGLVVAPILGREGGVEQLGPCMMLPADYVAEDLALGYASTVHAAQGRTVDTAHAVLGAGTDAAGAYVALTRGRYSNTAWTVTRSTTEDAEPGEAAEVEQRSPRAVLGEIIERSEDQLSALAESQQKLRVEQSTWTQLGQLVGIIERDTAGRIPLALDRLAAAGVLSEQDRVALAADEAMGSLEKLLRTAELAGHDPERVLADAAAGRGLGDARSPAQVLRHRVTAALRGQLSPTIGSCADLIPSDERIGAPEREWMARRAEAADERRRELGSEVALAEPRWAIDALGPVPEDIVARSEWEHRAGWAALYREVADHTDDTDPLGRAPGAGLAEHAALFRTAHEALDLPDRAAAEADLSDGQLRVRVRAFEREEAWAPRWTGDELAATTERAEQRRTDATVWSARAEATEDLDEREQLLADAQDARDEAAALAERAAELEAIDDARAAWTLHTAGTRDAKERAEAELKARGITLDDEHRVTADEWLAEHERDTARADAEREIVDEYELADEDDDLDAAGPSEVVVETAVPDIRETAVPDATEHHDPEPGRIPSADETAVAVARAQEALAEAQARAEYDTAAADADRPTWADDNAPAVAESAAETAADDDLVLERDG